MKALWFDKKLEVFDGLPIPRTEGEALVKVVATGICNTDIEISRGYAGFSGIPGHEFVGIVAESQDRSLLGCRVVGEINAGCGSCKECLHNNSRHCLKRTVLGIVNRNGAFAEYLSLPVRNLLVIPDEISDEKAVFVEPLAAACAIAEQVDVSASKVAVIGDGKLGLLISLVLKPQSQSLTLIGKHRNKLDIASRYAIDVCLDKEEKQKGSFDIIVEASGSSTGMALALELVRPRGKVVLKSTYAGALTLDASRVVVNEISIIGSRCGRFSDAIAMLRDSKVDPTPLISATFALSDAVEAFNFAQQRGVLKVIVKP